MYINKCTKCGAEFETKNPKRVICPNCLYPEKKEGDATAETNKDTPKAYSSYQPEELNNERQERPERRQGFQRRPQGDNRNSGFRRNNNNNRRPFQNGKKPFQRTKQRPQKKQLLVTKEQLAQIEELYKKSLPLPNPDIHEVIGAVIQLEPRKVFFGINLVRQKMFLPKLPFPKRKLAVSPEQLMAIKSLYEPLLPLPPIGCHKIIAAQLKMDEWRVHVGIGLIRKQMGLDRWNEDREDKPKDLK